MNGTLFFVANDGTHKSQLWKSDGTKAGTARVTYIINHSYDDSYGLAISVPPVAVGSRLFFFNDICCVGTSDLYVTDGTSAGTHPLTADAGLTISDGSNAAAFNGKFYFVPVEQFDPQGRLWVSNGTAAGTQRIAGMPVADALIILPASGMSLYFTAYYENNFEPYQQLWKTDGTKSGTQALTAVGELRSVPTEAAYMSKRLYFDSGYWDWEKNQDYVQLWKSDGSAAGTKPILTTENYRMDELTKSGNRLFFTVDGHLWKSNGTAAGTKEMGQFGDLWPTNLIAVGGELCFAKVNWEVDEWALWESDGTVAGTYKVRSFEGVGESWELQQVAVGSKLFFAADDGVHGAELWSYTP